MTSSASQFCLLAASQILFFTLAPGCQALREQVEAAGEGLSEAAPSIIERLSRGDWLGALALAAVAAFGGVALGRRVKPKQNSEQTKKVLQKVSQK